MNQRKLNNHTKAPFNEMKKRKLSLLLHFMPGKTCGDKGDFFAPEYRFIYILRQI